MSKLLTRTRNIQLIVFLYCFTPAAIFAQVEFNTGATFKYLKGESAQALSAAWNQPGFDDNGWSEGASPFWYGDGSGGTSLDDMQGNYSTLYLRSAFTAQNTDLISSLEVATDYDDGFILWINGEEVLRLNAPTTPAWDDFAPENHESGAPENYSIDSKDINLKEGENLLAVQGFNVSLTSSDFHFNISLDAEPELPLYPDSVRMNFSHESGYYVVPFYLHLDTGSDTSVCYYTLDGSHPATSATATMITGKDSVLIDPAVTENRAATPAVVVRTSFVEEGFQPSPPQSRTFIFHHKVIRQAYPGGKWPAGNVNEQVLDYAMDQDVSLGSAYSGRILGALKDVPVISLITDNDNLFDSQSGIYVNAFGHGPAWERECSVEVFDTDSVAFQVNAGIRIRGGWSRHPEFPKHSFRLFFRSEYGDSKLYFPLFGDEGTDRYDKIDLRTSQNYAWAQGDDRNTMLREVFSRDTQRDMGQPYTRSRYYHLYLNGMYWGLYQTQERSEARFASDYFGGESEDYDVVKVNTENWNYRVEATDGTLDLWNQIYGLTQDGFAAMEDYYRIEGKGPDGFHSKALNKLVDIDNLIDYMLTIFYAGNFDAPTSSFGNNNGPNNFYAINDRTDPTTGFIFFNHDAEHSLFVQAASPGIGIQEDRVNIGTRDDDMRMEVSSFSGFHPQWLHFRLSDNAEYRQRFADRAFRYFREGGALDEFVTRLRFEERMEQIDEAIIAESARWGDAGEWVSDSYTRDEHWVPEVNRVRYQFFSRRGDIVIDQLIAANLFTDLQPPVIEADELESGSKSLKFMDPFEILLLNPNVSGMICYTTDGTDPRLTGGEINPDAEVTAGQVTMDISRTSIIKARILDNGSWSPINELVCLSGDEDYSGLIVSELHYNPLDSVFGADTIPGTEFEFIELKNISDHGIDLSGVTIDSSIYYTFPEGSVLMPGAFFVVCSSKKDFYQRYGKIATGEYSRQLSNGGELLVFTDPDGELFLWFNYGDEAPWPLEADGQGYSLVVADTESNAIPGIAEYWNRSYNIGGSPFADDINTMVFYHPEYFAAACKVYPNPFSDYIVIEIEGRHIPEQVKFSLYSITGTKLFEDQVVPGAIVNMPSGRLNPGTYIGMVEYEGYRGQFKLMVID